ncbi:bile acid:sodium symporter family protein [Mycobacterium servetii]|uniref:Bile acid:sodium symporter family protein n=1 Tax=Mycobacterium servetii TaxID=3237418 RepID=A0ABV4C406_9MYCO
MADAAKLAFQISLFVVILGYGLTARYSDVTCVLRLPDLLARSLLAVLVVAPVIAAVLVSVLALRPQVAIALVALAITPLPSLLPRRGAKAGGHVQYGLGLVVVLAVLAVPWTAAATPLLGQVFGSQYVVSTWHIAGLVVTSVLAPLVAGMTIRSRRPELAERIAGPVERVQRWALPVAIIMLVMAAAPAMWKLMGGWTLVAVVLFVTTMVAIGHVLGGPDPRFSAVLAFAASCRHPATALTFAAANFPNADERGAVALYVLVTAAIGVLYTRWLRRRSVKLAS